MPTLSIPGQSASQADDAEKKAQCCRHGLRARYSAGAKQVHVATPGQTCLARDITPLAIPPIQAPGLFADAPRQQTSRDDKEPKQEDSNPSWILAELPPCIQAAGSHRGSSTPSATSTMGSSASWDVMTIMPRPHGRWAQMHGALLSSIFWPTDQTKEKHNDRRKENTRHWRPPRTLLHRQCECTTSPVLHLTKLCI